MSDKLKKRISAWRDREGYRQALSKLVIARVSVSAAQKLLAGTYKSDPNGLLLQAIEEAMK